MLDDIDTASDIAKGNNKLYRNLVGQYQDKKNDTGIFSNGHDLFLPTDKGLAAEVKDSEE